jgi:hypothetical protein
VASRNTVRVRSARLRLGLSLVTWRGSRDVGIVAFYDPFITHLRGARFVIRRIVFDLQDRLWLSRRLEALLTWHGFFLVN